MNLKFTRDWTSSWTPQWRTALGHLRGTSARGLEIGSFEGRSSVWLLQNILDHPDSRLHCIDPFADEAAYGRFTQNVAAASVAHKMELQRCPSQQAVLTDLPALDFAYIDGSHLSRDVLADAFKVWPHLKLGGILIFDDYLWPPAAVNRMPHHLLPSFAIDHFCIVMGDAFRLTHRGGQVIGAKIKP